MKFVIGILLTLPLIIGFTTYETGDGNVNYKKGIVKNLGEADNGCGWVVEIEGKNFKPKNLSKAFHKQNLKVNLDFDYSLTLYKCGNSKNDLQEIYVNWMEKIK